MPVKTASLSIKALPLEAFSNASQILSPSAILPSTSLFSLQITTLSDPNLKRTYKISVKQSNLLMQKSALFYDLSTEYTRLASYSSLNYEETSKQKLAEEADGLPMLCIEAPVNLVNDLALVDAFLGWLCTAADMKDTLTSSLASKIRSYQDFFSLLNFSTLLDLYEPYRTAVDEILVYYYFGLSAEERRIGILRDEQFVEGLIPGRFVKRLAEAVSEDDAKEIIGSFFRGKHMNNGKEEEWEELDDATTPDNDELEWINHHDHVTRSVSGTPLTAPLDYAEPPTPMGSAYFCIGVSPPTSCTPKIQQILPRSPQTPSAGFKQFPYSRPPPNTPKTPDSMEYCRYQDHITPTGVDLDKAITPSTSPLAPPNTPNTSTSMEGMNTLLSPPSYLVSPSTPATPKSRCASPSTPTIVISDSDFEQFSSQKSYSFMRRELFNNALSKMRKRTL